MRIETGIDLDRLFDVARLAEGLVGRQLPGEVMRGGSPTRLEKAALWPAGAPRNSLPSAIQSPRRYKQHSVAARRHLFGIRTDAFSYRGLFAVRVCHMRK
jgi:hypothetical protein